MLRTPLPVVLGLSLTLLWPVNTVWSQAFTNIDAGLDGALAASGAAAWGDYDGDGDLDLIYTGTVTNTTGVTRLYRNDDGAFVRAALNLPDLYASSLAWGDYDSDGDLDVFGMDGSTSWFRNDGGAFTETGPGAPGSYLGSSVGDYDNDGFADVALESEMGGRDIYHNDGNDAFTPIHVPFTVPDPPVLVTTPDPRVFVFGDYDGDGDLDIATVLGQSGDLEVYENKGSDQFQLLSSTPLSSRDIVAMQGADFDNDGDLDLLLHQYQNSVSIARNDGRGAFTLLNYYVDYVSAPYIGDWAHWWDHDRDGDLDLLMITSNSVRIYPTIGVPANTVPQPPAGLGAAVQGSYVNLSWQPGSDAETPAVSLSYNLRIGTAPGRSDVVDPLALPDGPAPAIAVFAPSGMRVITGIEPDRNTGLPSSFSLAPNYPNPFRTHTTIEFTLASPEEARLEVYDLLGHRVTTLVNAKQAAGTYRVVFDAAGLASGIYFYRLRTAGFLQTRKMVLLR